MKPIHMISMALAGLAVGIIGGRLLRPSPRIIAAPAPSASTAVPATKGTRLARNTPSGKETGHRLSSLRALYRKSLKDPYDIGRQLERMDTATLKDLATFFALSLNGPYDGPSRDAMEKILEEIFVRDGEKALEWVASSFSEESARAVWLGILPAVARTSPVLAKKWVDKNPELESYAAAQSFFGAADKSADAVIEAGRIFGYEPFKNAIVPPGFYPENFDFGKLFAAMGGRFPSDIFPRWTAENKEEAWAAVKQEFLSEEGYRGDTYLALAFKGACLSQGEQAGAAWIAGKLAELPSEKRDEAIRAVDQQGAASAEGISAVMQALPDKSDRITFARELVNPSKNLEKSLAALEHLSPEDQLQLVKESAEKYRTMDQGFKDGFLIVKVSTSTLHGFYEATARRLDFPEEDREQIREVLAGEGPK